MAILYSKITMNNNVARLTIPKAVIDYLELTDGAMVRFEILSAENVLQGSNSYGIEVPKEKIEGLNDLNNKEVSEMSQDNIKKEVPDTTELQ
jgi:antitoxin component of MazEF toxin-antitoxin module